jgi:signal transduction histidine kinase
MMTARDDTKFCVRDAVSALLSADEMGPLDELANVLLFVSGAIAQARRRCGAHEVKAVELQAIDDAFSRSIKLTREVRERLQARRGRGEYASMSHAARDVVGRLQGLLPDGVKLTLSCPLGPAIVAADGRELRRLLVGLLEATLDAVGTEGTIAVEVAEVATPSHARAAVARRSVRVDVRCSAVVKASDEHLSAAVRPLLRSFDGAIELREPLRGGTEISVRVPCAC